MGVGRCLGMAFIDVRHGFRRVNPSGLTTELTVGLASSTQHHREDRPTSSLGNVSHGVSPGGLALAWCPVPTSASPLSCRAHLTSKSQGGRHLRNRNGDATFQIQRGRHLQNPKGATLEIEIGKPPSKSKGGGTFEIEMGLPLPLFGLKGPFPFSPRQWLCPLFL